MTAGPVIAEASVADAEAISAFAIRTYVVAFGADMKPDDLALYLDRKLSVPRWIEYLARDRVLIARVDGDIAGYVQFGPAERSESVEIRRLYVDPKLQGRGLGTDLLQRALDAPEVSAAGAVYIDTWEENVGARRLYERFGFRFEGERVPFILRPGEVEGYDIVLVRRRPVA